MTKQPPLVSICCVTYNHANFIAQAINGFVMQKTNFEFEIVIGDDCSTDGTYNNIEPFLKKYPGLIRVVRPPKNMGAHHNMISTTRACKGKYIAFCEGDDYWTDTYKLQKQADFLENNPDYIICCHYTRVINATGETLYVHPKPLALQYTYFDLLAGRQEETKTATLFYRNLALVHQVYDTPWIYKSFAGDKMLKLYATQCTGQKIYVIPQVMSCYRNHQGGIWSMINTNARMEMMISDFNLIIKNFSYPRAQKKKLLWLYIKRYLIFEIRNHKLHNAFGTVKYLL